MPAAAAQSKTIMTASPRMLIDGRLCDAAETLDVLDPATTTVFATVPDCARAQLDAAVAAARRAFGPWSEKSLQARQAVVRRMIERVRAHIDEVAVLLTHEQGKPKGKATSEINAALFFCAGYCEMELAPEIIRSTDQQRVELRHSPIGVVGAIAAWNYPILLALWKLAPAVIAGNTVIVKPSPHTPVATLRVGELIADIFPPGVVNVVSGGDDLGRWMTAHDGIGKISFTGSAETGKDVLRSAAGNLKRVTLELGGNDAGIVLDDVDPEQIATELFDAAFSNCGQVCAGLKRLFVPARLEEAIAANLARVAAKIKVGCGFDDGVQMGPIQNAAQFRRVKELLADATASGAELYFQGEVPPGPGYFVPITLVRGARPGSRIVDEEPFGPVLPIIPYRSEAEAVAMANDTAFGLGASVWGKDVDRAVAIAARLDAGSRWVNQHPAMGPDIPFGGIKQSGIGVECSVYGLKQFTNIQVLNVKRK
jgi:acyl-CoA reductase-like NAD-dependent aldehyde dehydrogenase